MNEGYIDTYVLLVAACNVKTANFTRTQAFSGQIKVSAAPTKNRTHRSPNTEITYQGESL